MAVLLPRSSLEHAVAGSAGSVLASLLLFPLERLKTLQQLERGFFGEDQHRLLLLLRRILQKDGVRGLYRGCLPMAQTVGASSFLYFFLFQGLKRPLAGLLRRRDGRVGPYASLLSSAVAGAVNMLFTEPLWRACVVAQDVAHDSGTSPAAAAGLRGRRGVWGTVWRMWRKEGPRALWRGLGSSMWLVSNPVIQYFVYDFLKAVRLQLADMSSMKDISSLEAFTLGAIAKALATLLTFPLQVAQSRLRAAREGGDPLRPELQGVVACLGAIFRERGIAGLYFGLYAKLLQTVTQAAFMFAIYEKVHWVIRRISRQGVREFGRQLQKLK